MKHSTPDREAVDSVPDRFTKEERAKTVLTCGECGGKFAPGPRHKRHASVNFCTSGCRLANYKRRMTNQKFS